MTDEKKETPVIDAEKNKKVTEEKYDYNKLYKNVEVEIKALFGRTWDSHKEDLRKWIVMLADRRMAKARNNFPDDIHIIESDIEFCMFTISAIKQSALNEIGEGFWVIIEKSLRMLVRILLTTA